MHGIADRIHDCTGLDGNSVEVHHVARRHRDEFGERSVTVDADDRRADAEMSITRAARDAVTADDVPFRRDQVAHCESSVRAGLGAKRCDLAGKLVTDHHRRMHAT